MVVLEWSLGTETNKIMFETGRRSERGHRRHRYAGIVERKGKGMLTERRSAFLLLGVESVPVRAWVGERRWRGARRAKRKVEMKAHGGLRSSSLAAHHDVVTAIGT